MHASLWSMVTSALFTLCISLIFSHLHREIDRKLDAIGSLLSPPPEVKAIELEYPTQLDDTDDDENIILSASKARSRSQPPTKVEIPLTSREFMLKFRCRTDLYKIPVISV